MASVYRLLLVPVDDDGTISAPVLEAAKAAAPRISKEQPIDVDMARTLVLSNLEGMESFCRWLRGLAQVLPVSKDWDAMFDDCLPCDQAAFLFAAVENAGTESLPSVVRRLRRAATVTDEELRQDYFERHVRYLAEQAHRRDR